MTLKHHFPRSRHSRSAGNSAAALARLRAVKTRRVWFFFDGGTPVNFGSENLGELSGGSQIEPWATLGDLQLRDPSLTSALRDDFSSQVAFNCAGAAWSDLGCNPAAAYRSMNHDSGSQRISLCWNIARLVQSSGLLK
ncbi:hypothetical protein DFH09DRAFT_1068384 [Mycena vulgaris]|nr:hypothetical protein DFH09DRAFT_1068384 [Mycena vulgaris]